ncbi:hypothetical protein ACUNWD_07740 [Sunxiuqinia sp. A32]|uniref:hypothetical protein n=1 Tax=Sunxiuqinia sp. A32 TaxID=3461496 RepID=UPI0040452C6F
MKLDKVLTIMLWVLLAVSAFLVVSMMANISENDADPTMNAWINTNITWSYLLLGISAVVAIVFALLHTFTDKDAAKKGLMALVFAGVVLAISYALSTDALPEFYGVEKFIADGSLTNSISKWIDTTLYATYILLLLAIVATVVSSVSRVFK